MDRPGVRLGLNAAAVGLLLTVGAFLFRLGQQVEHNSNTLTRLVQHTCRIEVALHKSSAGDCLADFGVGGQR